MKILFRLSLSLLICLGTLIIGTQSWAKKEELTTTKSTTIMGKNEKVQPEHDHHQSPSSSKMEKMDYSDMKMSKTSNK